MTVGLRVDATDAERVVADVAGRLAAIHASLGDLWNTIGARIRTHIGERWRESYGTIAPLSPVTMEAREKRRGYYGRAPGSESYLRRGTPWSFWWTGKALGRAIGPSAFRVSKSALVYDFGIDNGPRRRLEWMHFGNPAKNRPPRPIYDQSEVEAITEHTLKQYVDRILSSFGGYRAVIRRSD